MLVYLCLEEKRINLSKRLEQCKVEKRYRIDTRKNARGQDTKTFVETKYSPLLSESESEREDSQPNKPWVASQYSPSKPESLQKPESNKSQSIFTLPLRLPLPLQEEIWLMILSCLFSKELDREIQSSFGFYVKLYGPQSRATMKI